jgi:Asp-tRNA(Asn)/Glu-tRNA(Gln) amidotransferase A subunit family amidase
MPVGRALPLGLQLTADLGQDARLLQAALLVYRKFSGGPTI